MKFKSYKILPLKTIEDAFQNKWSTSLLYYCKLSKLYNNTTFYNYKSDTVKLKIANRLNIHVNTLKKHVLVLEKKGLAYWHGNNLQLVGLNKLKLIYKTKILVPVELLNNENKRTQILALGFPIIRRNLDLQECEINCSIEIIKMHNNLLDKSYNSNDIKRLLKKRNKRESIVGKKINYEKATNVFTTLSNNSIENLLNLTNGSKIQTTFNKLGYIHSFERIKLLGKKANKEEYNLLKKYNEDSSKVFRSKNGDLFTQDSNLIIKTSSLKNNNKSIGEYIKSLYSFSNDVALSKFYDKKKTIIEIQIEDKYKNETSRIVKSLKKEFYNEKSKDEFTNKDIDKFLLTINMGKNEKHKKAINTIKTKYGDNLYIMNKALQTYHQKISEYGYQKRIERIEKWNKENNINFNTNIN